MERKQDRAWQQAIRCLSPPRAAALVASVVLALLSPCTARADEALLPSPDDIGDPGLSEQEVARIEEPELDPTDSGATAPGLEPDGAELAGLLDGYLDEAFPACVWCNLYVQVKRRMTSTKSFPYFSFLNSPMPLTMPKDSTVVGRASQRFCKTLSDMTM